MAERSMYLSTARIAFKGRVWTDFTSGSRSMRSFFVKLSSNHEAMTFGLD